MRSVVLVSALAVASCATPTEQQALTAGAATLATVAAQDNVRVNTLVLGGALFCQKVLAAEQPAVALANLAGAPVSVVDRSSNEVTAACAAVQSVPVSPPADPAAAPIMRAAVALSAI